MQQWRVVKTQKDSALHKGKIICFFVNVYVVDMISDKLSWDRRLCSSLCSNKVAGNSGNWGIVSVTFCLSEGHFRLRATAVPSVPTTRSQNGSEPCSETCSESCCGH